MEAKIGDEVCHKSHSDLRAVITGDKSPSLWEVRYTEGSRTGQRGTWMKRWTMVRTVPVRKPVGHLTAQMAGDDGMADAIEYGKKILARADYNLGNYAKQQEEIDMQFVRVQKQLLVDGLDLLTMTEGQLFDFIQTTQKRIDELNDIEFESSRIEQEIDTLNGLMKKAIKIMDNMA